MGIILKPLLFIGLFSLFCTTKVSEWVLLNNIPENYLLVFHANQNTGNDRQATNQTLVSKISSANIQFRESGSEKLKESYYTLYYRKRVVRNYSTLAELKGLPGSAPAP